MMVNIVYLFIGLTIGFLVKHELDIKSRRKRVAKRLECFSNIDVEKHNEALKQVKELNRSLISLQQRREAR